jgi:hypothetical protein
MDKTLIDGNASRARWYRRREVEMTRNLCVLFAIALLLVSSASHADFVLQSKIPAPVGCASPIGKKVTGLGWRDVGPGSIFATTQCNESGWHCYLHVLRTSDGHVYWETEFTIEPPYCGAEAPYLSAGDHLGGNDYVVGDECGEIMWITFTKDTVYMWDSYDPVSIGEPSGLIIDNDTLYVLDRDTNQIVHMLQNGTVLGTYPLLFGVSPTAMAMRDGNLFIMNQSDSSKIFEATTRGAVVDTHSVAGLYGLYPNSAVFVDDLLYIGGLADSIYIFRQNSYTEPIEPGDSVEVDLIPGELMITFDGVVDSGYVTAEVFDQQPCPPPSGVTFLSDFYEITTTSQLEHISELAFTDTALGDDHDIRLLRVFSRPSGPCDWWRDITVDSAEVIPTFRRLTRSRSEDDEFSVFGLALDERNQYNVVRDKFRGLEDHMQSAEDSIPAHTYSIITALYDRAESNFLGGYYLLSALRVDSIATWVRSDPAIPHVYDPADPGKNVAGRIISRAHTLSFSIRFYPQWLAGVHIDTPGRRILLAVSPNPSGSAATIEFAPVGAEPVEIAVYSVMGERVKTLFRGHVGSGPMSFTWEADNDMGNSVATGMYFAVAKQGSRIATRKIVIQR